MSFKEKFKSSLHQYKHLYRILLIVVVCAILSGWVYHETVNPVSWASTPSVANDSMKKAVDLETDSEYAQTVTVSQHIDKISFRFGKYGKITNAKIFMTVTEQSTGQTIFETILESEDFKENELYSVKVGLNENSELDQVYKLSLSVADEGNGNPVAMWTAGEDSYLNGTMSINGVEQHNDITFTVYSGRYHFITVFYWAAAVCIVLFLVFLYALIFIWKSKIQHVFLASVVFLGGLYMILLPPNSVPDEEVHINSAYRQSNILLFQKDAEEEFVMKRAEDTKDIGLATRPSVAGYQKVSHNFFKMAEDTTMVQTEGSSVGGMFAYLPAAVGVTLGRLLHLGQLPMLYLGRMFNLAFFALVTYFAIKKMPFGKMILFTIALFPMTLQEAGSFSYDALLISLSFFVIAYSLHLIYEKGRINVLRDIVPLCVASAWLTTIKGGIYAILCLLCILISKTRFSKKKRYYALIGTILGITALAFVLNNLGILMDVSSIQSPTEVSGPALYSASFLRNAPVGVLKVFLDTLRSQFEFYLGSMIGGPLGWLEIQIPWILTYTFLGLAGLSAFKTQQEQRQIKVSHKIWMALVTIGISILIFTALLVGITPLSSKTIWGVQGRYFLPILPLLLLLLRVDNLTLKKNIDRPIMFAVLGTQVLTLAELFRAIVIPIL